MTVDGQYGYVLLLDMVLLIERISQVYHGRRDGVGQNSPMYRASLDASQAITTPGEGDGGKVHYRMPKFTGEELE
jgi:hypothetical protein